MTKAYTDVACQEPNTFFRFFEKTVDDEELHWHMDKSNREVVVVSGKGWKFQYENKTPFELVEGDTIKINKMNYHRLIKGDTTLILKIIEN